MLTSRGPLNISGKRVSTSTFIPLSRSTRRCAGVLLFVLDDLDGATQTLFGAARQQQGADRIDRHALPPDDPSDIAFVQAQFVNRHSIPLHRSDNHVVGMLHQPFDNVFQEPLHKLPESIARLASALLPCWLS